MTKKRCTKCGIIKDLSEFHVDRRHKDGRCVRCKECEKDYYQKNKERIKETQREYGKNNRVRKRLYAEKNKEHIKAYRKAYYENNKEYFQEQSKAYAEKNREHIKELSRAYYENNKESLLEYKKRNKKRFQKRRRAYTKNNKEHIKAYSKEYFKTPNGKAAIRRAGHKRRARMNNTEATLTAEEWTYILKKQNNKCNICGKRFCIKRPPTLDHIIPVKHNGACTSDNIQALCHSCNSSKRAKVDKHFIQTWTVVES